jgi:hypothetical protein
MKPVFWLWGSVLLILATGVHAEQLGVGSRLAPFSLSDQHGVVHEVDASVKAILFSRDMDGGTLIRDALGERPPVYLASRGVVFVADISGMPRLIARIFALPSMRKRSYPMLLDRDGTTTADLPDEEGRATLILLDAMEIVEIVSMDSTEQVESQLTSMPAKVPAKVPAD